MRAASLVPVLVPAALALAVIAPAGRAAAQAPADTSGVLATVAVALRGNSAGPEGARADSARRADVWRVAPDDALTSRLAAALGHPIRTAPPSLVCRWGAPAGADVGLVVRAALRFTGPDTAHVSIEHSCGPAPGVRRGGFLHGDHLVLVRRGAAWAVVGHHVEIT